MGTVTALPWAVLDLAGTGVAAGSLIVLHLLPTGLSPLRDPVSRYGITRYRLGYRVQTIAFGVAGLAAATAVVTAGPSGTHRGGIVALLIVFGLCRLAISWWPMDQPGVPTSTHGTVHLFLAMGAFLAATAAANRLLAEARDPAAPFDAGFRTAIEVAFWLMVVGLVGMFLLRRLRRPGSATSFFGAAERLVYLGIIVLLTTAGVALA